MLKKLVLSLALTFSFLSARAGVEKFDSGTSGLGLIVGQPLLARYQLWDNWKRAYFFDAGYNFDKILVGGIHYMFYFYDVKDFWRTRTKSNALLFYIGPGAYFGYNVGTSDPNQILAISVRGIGGVEYVFAGRSYALRAEVGPAVNIIGRTFLSVQGGVGITYYFGGDSSHSSAGKAEDKSTNEDELSIDSKPPPPKTKPSNKIKKEKKSKPSDEDLDEFK